jgi:hypothetical protein
MSKNECFLIKCLVPIVVTAQASLSTLVEANARARNEQQELIYLNSINEAKNTNTPEELYRSICATPLGRPLRSIKLRKDGREQPRTPHRNHTHPLRKAIKKQGFDIFWALEAEWRSG